MDKKLFETLDEFAKKIIFLKIIKNIGSGKEADVYLVVNQDNEKYALKVYKDAVERSFKNNQIYLSGKFLRSKSERRAIQKRNKFGKNLIHLNWVKREFFLMSKLYNLGCNIPKPIASVKQAILMQFVGENDNPASLLKDVIISKKQAREIYKSIKSNMEKFQQLGIVHADLSPFNILFFKSKIYIIDFPQSVDIRNNYNAQNLLEKDKRNIDKWYIKTQI